MISKSIGRDCELSTTGIDSAGSAIEPWSVTRSVLDHIDAAFEPLGTATWSRSYQGYGGYGGYRSASSSDCLRHWAPNGQCFYSDMSHVELCTAETTSPRSYAAQCLCALEIVEAARARAEALAPAGTRYILTTSNVDALDPSISWGTHVNVSVSSELWENLFEDPRHPSVLGFVVSAMSAAIPFFGAGYVLPLQEGGPIFSLSGRAHHLSRVSTYSTTKAFERGLLNSRREAHADGLERLHLIGFDFCLVAAALKACFLQCCLAAAEEGFGDLNVFDPVRATRIWSWSLDPESGRFEGEVPLVSGAKRSLPAYVHELSTRLLEMVECGLITEEAAPGARELLPRIVSLAEAAECGRITDCARHLDWAAKLLVLLDVAGEHGGGLGTAAVRLADHDFGNTDPERGAFWRLWRAGRVDPLVTRAELDAHLVDGPPESRGWARGRLLQSFPREVSDVDWDHVELRLSEAQWGRRLKVEMPRPDGTNHASFGPLLDGAGDVAELAERLDESGEHARRTDPVVDIERQLDYEQA